MLKQTVSVLSSWKDHALVSQCITVYHCSQGRLLPWGQCRGLSGGYGTAMVENTRPCLAVEVTFLQYMSTHFCRKKGDASPQSCCIASLVEPESICAILLYSVHFRVRGHVTWPMASKNEAGQQQSGDQWHSAVNAVNPMNAENAIAFSLKSSPHKAHLGVTVSHVGMRRSVASAVAQTWFLIAVLLPQHATACHSIPIP